MVTMWPKRQQTEIKFKTKNVFINISAVQSSEILGVRASEYIVEGGGGAGS